MKKRICAALLACLLAGCSERNLPAARNADSVPESSVSAESASDEPEPLPEPAVSAADPSVLTAASEEPAKEPDAAPARKESPQDAEIREVSGPPEPPKLSEAAGWELLLANDSHEIGDYTPALAEVQNGYKMDERVAESAKRMIADAQAQGVALLVCSAYRPYSSQERNFNNSVESYVAAGLSRDKAVSETKKLIAVPGKSEHQTGLAADIVTPAYQNLDDGYAETAAAKWLAKNAPDYGFILRYPKDKTAVTGINYEPWHFRYVGADAAREITKAGLCLEEYLQ